MDAKSCRTDFPIELYLGKGQDPLKISNYSHIEAIHRDWSKKTPDIPDTYIVEFVTQVMGLARYRRTLKVQREFLLPLMRTKLRKALLHDLLERATDNRRTGSQLRRRAPRRKVAQDKRSPSYLTYRMKRLLKDITKKYGHLEMDCFRFTTILGTPITLDGTTPADIAASMVEQAKVFRKLLTGIDIPYKLIGYWDTEIHITEGLKKNKDTYCRSYGLDGAHGILLIPHLHCFLIAEDQAQTKHVDNQIGLIFGRPFQTKSKKLFKNQAFRENIQYISNYLFKQKTSGGLIMSKDAEKALRDEIMTALGVQRWYVRTGTLLSKSARKEQMGNSSNDQQKPLVRLVQDKTENDCLNTHNYRPPPTLKAVTKPRFNPVHRAGDLRARSSERLYQSRAA